MVPTLDESAAKGYGVCDACRDTVDPRRWNRFSAGLPDVVADHITDALFRPRKALLRGAFGSVPWGGLGVLALAGCLGVAWLILQIADPNGLAGVRFGRGFLEIWKPVGVFATFAVTMHLLQPGGPGEPTKLARTLTIVATGAVPAWLTWALVGVSGYVVPMFLPGAWSRMLAVVAVGVSSLWSAGLTGRGLALRRGASPAVGIGAALAGVVVTGLLMAVVLWLRLNPPWAHAWDAAERGPAF